MARFVTILLAAAATTTFSSPIAAQEVTRNSYATTRVLFGRCMYQHRAEGAGATLLTFGLSRAFNLVSELLKSAGQDEVVTYTGTGNAESSADDLANNCITVIRGRFAADVSEADIEALNTSAPAWAASMQLPTGALSNLATNHNVFLVAPPDFLFEGLIVRSNNGEAFTLRPLYAALNSPYRSSVLGGNRQRHIALAVSFVAPNAEFDADDNPGTEVVLGELQRRRPLRFRFGADQPADGEEVEEVEEVVDVGDEEEEAQAPPRERMTYRQQPLESRWFPINADTVDGPFTVRVVVTETRSGSALARFLSDAFEEVRPELEQHARNRLIPAEAAEARAAELTAANEREEAFVTAFDAAVTALNECATATADAGFEADAARFRLVSSARAAQRTANGKAQPAGRNEPFADDAIIPLSGAPSVVGRCGEVRDEALGSLGN